MECTRRTGDHVAVPAGPGLGAHDAVAVEELVVDLTVGVTGATDAHVLEQTQVLDLMEHQRVVEVVGRLLLVGLDATDVVRGALGQGGHQNVDRLLDLEAGGGGLLLGSGDLLGLGEETLQKEKGMKLEKKVRIFIFFDWENKNIYKRKATRTAKKVEEVHSARPMRSLKSRSLFLSQKPSTL
jgi:hypothetical protein